MCIMAITHSLCLWDFSTVYLWCLIKEELYLKTFLHYSTSSLWSLCLPNPGLYQSWHFLFALPEQILQKYFPLGLTSLFQTTSTPGLPGYLVKLLTRPFRALPLVPVGLLILAWKREKPHRHQIPMVFQHHIPVHVHWMASRCLHSIWVKATATSPSVSDPWI